MKKRFSGPENRDRLVEVLLDQKLVQRERGVAEKLADSGTLVEFKAPTTIIEQGGTDTDVYFIINGKVTIFVNNREVATRGPGEAVGEMAAIDPSARRSATSKAGSDVLALKVGADTFVKAAEGSASVWKAAVKIIADRLREREKFHRPANLMPIMFVGSSVEGLEIARAVENHMKHDHVVVRLWTTGVFGPSKTPIEDLIRQVNEADFALFVFGPDDRISSRDEEQQAPRDNVVFEMGLFMGRLGRDRVFMIKDSKSDLKIPSDLTGVQPLAYVSHTHKKLAEQVGPVCNELREAIKGLGAI